MLASFFKVFFSAFTYYLFNKMYFRLVCNSQKIKDISKKWEIITFLFNFFIFYVCSDLKLSLVYNWLVFCFFLFLETYYLYRSPLRNAAFLALQGIICGLSANVLNRCFFAIVLNRNLISFANDPYIDGNIKSIPITLGFFTTAMVFYLYSQAKHSEKLSLMFQYPKHMLFLFKVMIVITLCLLVHLVLYNYDANDIILKLWGLSSSVFVVIGYLLGLNYTIRLCELEAVKVQNEKLKILVKSQQELEDMLKENIYLDELTGFYNRQFADQKIQELFEDKTSFMLCFIDLNGLKYVNDQLGHSQGDHYILMVSQALTKISEQNEHCFRYGGDEFIVLFQLKNKDEICALLDSVNTDLAKVSLALENDFHMSLSYGVVASDEQESVERLIEQADSIMYEQKKQHAEFRRL